MERFTLVCAPLDVAVIFTVINVIFMQWNVFLIYLAGSSEVDDGQGSYNRSRCHSYVGVQGKLLLARMVLIALGY
jgi:hypothetical protein